MAKNIAGLIVTVIGLFAVYLLYKGNMALGIASLVVCVLVGLYLLGKSEEKKEASSGVLEVTETGGYAYVGKDQKFDFEQAKSVRDEMMKNIKPDDISLEINAAAEYMLNKDFTGCIRAYENIIEKYPERKGDCLGQIGAAEFFLGNYEKALEKYIESKNCGEDNDMTEDNIWEVCEIICKEKGTKEHMEKYISLYPQGRYVKKANKLIS